MPFPEITTATTPLPANVPARSGNGAGGTSYMIPAHTARKALKASMLFLQFMSSPSYLAPWLARTGGIAAVKGVTPPGAARGVLRWRLGQAGDHQSLRQLRVRIAPGVPETDAYDGYLLGSKSLSQEISYLDGLLRQGARYLVENDGWSNLLWAKSLPGSS